MNREFRLTGVAAVGIALGTAVLLLFAPTMMNDFVEYWAAARLNLAGQNPYDPALMLELERSVGFAGDRALMMLNPPPVLTLVMPFGVLPYRPAAFLWFVLHVTALLWSCAILWDLAGGPRRLLWVAYLCGLVFVPTLFALFLGQISILLLLGLALFLRFVRDGRMIAAGAATTLLLVKPHVVYLVGAALLAWWFRSRDRRVLLGVALGSVGFLVPLAFNPAIYAQHFEFSRVESLTHFTTSTLGALLRLAAGDSSRFGLQFVPMILGLTYLATRLRRSRFAEWDWDQEMPLLVVVSLATAAYGWVFDQVVLLVAAIPMFAVAIRAGGVRLVAMIGFWSVTGVIAFTQAFRGVNSFWYFWIPFAFLAAMIVLGPIPRYPNRPVGSQSSLEENCRKGTGS
jgi:hypothetical protein